MIFVQYCYYKKTTGKWYRAEKSFTDINKAVRFMYAIRNSKDKVYDGFSCEDSETCEEINRRFF